MDILEIGTQSLNAGDFLLLFAIIVVWPIYTYVSIKKYPVEIIRDDPNIRLDSYNKSMLHLWGLASGVLLIWLFAERPFAALGFQHVPNWQTLSAWAIAVFGILYSAVLLYQVHTNDAVRQKIGGQLRDVGEMTHLLMPRTDKEYRRSMLVGITAGITEEIIFRGYLIWVFSLYFPVWFAGLLSIGIFVLLHIYQEKSGLIQVALFAAFANLMYVASGSLWPVIILHIGVDVLNVSTARKVSHETGF